MNHMDIKCISTFQSRIVHLADYTTGAAAVSKPPPELDYRTCCNQSLANAQLGTSTAHTTQVLLLFGHSHFDALLFSKPKE